MSKKTSPALIGGLVGLGVLLIIFIISSSNSKPSGIVQMPPLSTINQSETESESEPEQEANNTEKSDSKPTEEEAQQAEEQKPSESSEREKHVLQFGDLLSETETCTSYTKKLKCKEYVLVIKAKITPSYNNKATITQNYHNMEEYIKNYDVSKFKEIQYWAVADMTDGNESKAISFTIPKRTINLVKEGKVVAIQFSDGYVQDLWILPSLRDDK